MRRTTAMQIPGSRSWSPAAAAPGEGDVGVLVEAQRRASRASRRGGDRSRRSGAGPARTTRRAGSRARAGTAAGRRASWDRRRRTRRARARPSAATAVRVVLGSTRRRPRADHQRERRPRTHCSSARSRAGPATAATTSGACERAAARGTARVGSAAARGARRRTTCEFAAASARSLPEVSAAATSVATTAAAAASVDGAPSSAAARPRARRTRARSAPDDGQRDGVSARPPRAARPPRTPTAALRAVTATASDHCVERGDRGRSCGDRQRDPDRRAAPRSRPRRVIVGRGVGVLISVRSSSVFASEPRDAAA